MTIVIKDSKDLQRMHDLLKKTGFFAHKARSGTGTTQRLVTDAPADRIRSLAYLHNISVAALKV